MAARITASRMPTLCVTPTSIGSQQVCAKQLEQASYILLFTTAPAGRLSAARAVEAYRLRWQIEPQFKRWKSLCRFDRLPNYRDDTIKSWLTGKLLLGLVVDRIGAQTLPVPANSS